MGDGITQVARDTKIVDKLQEVRRLQGKFFYENSPELAKEIVDKLKIIKNFPRGAFNCVNQYKVEQDIEYYQEYFQGKNSVVK